MNKLTFTRTNGNVPKTLAGKDHISGLLYYIGADELPEGFSATNRIQLVSSIETAEKLGIKANADAWNIRNLHHQLSQIFRINNGITLYVGLFTKPTGNFTFTEIKQMQNFAGGDIRQIAVWNGTQALVATDVTTLQGVATALENEDVPLSIIYAPKVTNVSGLPSLAGSNQKNVSVVIGQDGEGVAGELHSATDRNGATVSGVGIVLGLVSLAKVNESIAWVQKFPTGVALPAFGDGSLYRTYDSGVIEALDDKRYLFFLTYSGLNGSFMNDSHNLDAATSDYNAIELVRTMDKAVRGVRTYLLPELGSPLYIDPKTGALAPETVKHLETVANYQLADMQMAGELSGWAVEIDPDQNVLASSTVEFVIKNVAVGVFRKGVVKIGWAQSV